PNSVCRIDKTGGRWPERGRQNLDASGNDGFELLVQPVVVEPRYTEFALRCKLAGVVAQRVLVDRLLLEDEQVRTEQPVRQLTRTMQLVGKCIGGEVARRKEAQAARVSDSRRELRRRRTARKRREHNRRDRHSINRTRRSRRPGGNRCLLGDSYGDLPRIAVAQVRPGGMSP